MMSASKAPITIQKKRRQDDSFGVEEPFARGGRASGGAQAFLPPQAMTGMPFGSMDPFALMMAMAASQNLLQGQNGGFVGSSGVHEAQDPSRTRCRFFPKCTKPGCPFVHPSIPCRNGKACAFGRQCLYLHKSDGLVRRLQLTLCVCTSVTLLLCCAGVQTGGGDKSSVPCKFGTRCNKITCPFAHPERFAGAQPSELGVCIPSVCRRSVTAGLISPWLLTEVVEEAILSETLPRTP
jgi:RNA-binding, Nab2-type zinc finger